MDNLRLLENELVPVYTTSTGEKVVYGKDLHRKLEIKTDFSTWVKRRFNECDAEEHTDFEVLPIFGENLSGGRPQIDYIIKIDTAKEMAMLEKNDIGKGVRKYFIQIEKKYKENKEKNNIEQGIAIVKFIADDLRVNEASRILMYENYCKDVGISTSFLPKYENNGSREQCSATELLQRNACNIKTAKFNQLLIMAGYMEIRKRKSGKGGIKEYKALTEKGLKYGINLISCKNQKEVQPYYYADTFMELYDNVSI